MPLFHPLPPSRPGSPPSSPTALLNSQGLPTSATPPFSPSSFAPRRKTTNAFHPDTSVPIPPSLQKSPFLTHEGSPFRRRSIEPAGKDFTDQGKGGVGGVAVMSRLDSGYSEGLGGEFGSSSDEDSSALEDGSGVILRKQREVAKSPGDELSLTENYLPTLLVPLSINIDRPPVSPSDPSSSSSSTSTSTSSSSRSPLPIIRPTFSRVPSAVILDLPSTPPAVFLPSPSAGASSVADSESPPSNSSSSLSSLVLSIEPSPALSIILPSPGSLSSPRVGHVDTPCIPFGEDGEEGGECRLVDASGTGERRTGSGYFQISMAGEAKDE